MSNAPTINAIHRFQSIMRQERTPPPFIELYAMWVKEDNGKCLRFGQWFYNRFLGTTFGEVRELVDKLHAETDIRKCQDMIETLYKNYQWPMA